ncbi:hypothetical protein ABEB36_006009 [Hypothenemus hampei]|uniref:FAST kinase leucine-rich domain-containing protein n=2 Tax=Hypothenemus hampei TaxID=57062 RepID=A0ABD1F076_HYPHA
MKYYKYLFKKSKISFYLNNTFSCRRNFKLLIIKKGVKVPSEPPKGFQNNQLCLSKSGYFPQTDIDETTNIYPESQHLPQSDNTRNKLFVSNEDSVNREIEKCASVEDVFKVVRINVDRLNHRHLAHVILALYELQSIFVQHYEEEDEDQARRRFYKKLLEHNEFFIVTEKIISQLDSSDSKYLGCIIYYLTKLGVKESSQLIQDCAIKLRDHLLNEFSLSSASQLLRVVFQENSVRPYYIVSDLIPKVFQQIDSIETVKDLEDLTNCMYRLHNILTSDILNNYERKIQQLINNKILTERDVQAILKVASLFNIPIWRHRFSAIISKCLLLMKNSIESCSFEEMYYLYEIFFKNQEPGDILNIIQRSAAKLLHEIEDTPIINHKNKLQLFSSIIYFSSPISKANFRQNIGQYLNGNQTLQTLISLRKVFSYLKISDNKLWNDYWNQMCQILKEEKNFEKIIKLMENYMYFSMDIYGFKHYAFEHCVFTLIQKYINEGTLTLYPARLFSSFSFVLMCSPHSKLFNNLMGSFVELSSQLTILDIFKISYSIQYSRQKKNLVDDLILKEIQEKLHKGTFKIFSKRNLEPTSVALLTKSMVIRRDFCNYLIEDMLTSLKSMPRMSSKLLEYICYNLAATKYLIPELLNLCTNYVIQHKGNIVGFNIEKIICLLYELNYHPIYDEEFFEAVIDILIRDQERMSGLAFIQAALALSFFNRLPKSLIRQIFNVEFLEKLDVELANCYFKIHIGVDVYIWRLSSPYKSTC